MLSTQALAIIAAGLSGGCEMGGLFLIAVGIKKDRDKARSLFGGTTIRVGPARAYARAGVATVSTGARTPTTEERVADLEVQVDRVYHVLDDRLHDARVQTDEALDEAKLEVYGEVDARDREIRGHLADVLAGSLRSRIFGAALLGFGIIFGVAANVLGDV